MKQSSTFYRIGLLAKENTYTTCTWITNIHGHIDGRTGTRADIFKEEIILRCRNSTAMFSKQFPPKVVQLPGGADWRSTSELTVCGMQKLYCIDVNHTKNTESLVEQVG